MEHVISSCCVKPPTGCMEEVRSGHGGHTPTPSFDARRSPSIKRRTRRTSTSKPVRHTCCSMVRVSELSRAAYYKKCVKWSAKKQSACGVNGYNIDPQSRKDSLTWGFRAEANTYSEFIVHVSKKTRRKRIESASKVHRKRIENASRKSIWAAYAPKIAA